MRASSSANSPVSRTHVFDFSHGVVKTMKVENIDSVTIVSTEDSLGALAKAEGCSEGTGAGTRPQASDRYG